MLSVVGQLQVAQVGRTGIFLSLEGQEHVILVGVHVLLTNLVDVIHILQAYRMNGELLSVIFLVDERVFHQSVIFQLAVFCAVGHVTIQEEALVESGSRGSTYTEAGTLDGITTDVGVHRTKLKLAQIFLLIGLHIARGQDRHDFLCDIKDGDGAQFLHQHLHRIFLALSGSIRSVCCPILLRTSVG